MVARIAAAALISSLAVLSAHPFDAQRKTPLLDAARAALGGEARLSALKAVRVSGRWLVRNEFYGKVLEAREEFIGSTVVRQVLLPDRYLTVRTRDVTPMVQQTGFAADVLINKTALPDGRVTEGWTGPEALKAERESLARFMLIMFLRGDTPARLDFAGEDASRGTLRFSGPRGSAAVIELDPATHLPLRLRFTVTMVASGEQREHVTTVDERRVVSGLNVPVRLTTSAKGAIVDRWIFDRVEIDPPLGRADFVK